ncbi:MAG: PQQ-binding-like beta-propeller repeat protein [Deltaproteobacteria bacterium]|nr:PQQ-binding-like beta-propeller repeat protein [Deltaproteobacteria bacterium]
MSTRPMHVATLAVTLALAACSSEDSSGGGGGTSDTGAGNGSGGSSGDGSAGGSGGGGAAATADWTMLGYDLHSTYWNQKETKVTVAGARGLTKAWEVDFQGGSVTSTPVIAGGKVYLASSSGVLAVDLATGAELWRQTGTLEAPLGASSSMAFEDGTLYLNDGGGVVRAMRASDGVEIWSYDPPEPWIVGFSSVVVAGDLLITGTSGLEEVGSSNELKAGKAAETRGHVFALNKKDGKLAWKGYTVDPPSTGVGIWSTPSVDLEQGIVIAATGNTYTGPPSDTADAFVAFPLATGASRLWHPQILEQDVYPAGNGPDGDFGANPVLFDVGGRKLAAGGAKMGDVFVIDRTNGEIVKQRNLGPASAFKGGIFVNGAWDGERLLFACNGATSTGAGSEGVGAALFALDPLTLDIVWERQIGGSVWGMISVANGVGFYGKDKVLQAFDTKTGEVLSEFPTEGSIATAPAVSNGHVVFGSGMSWITSTPGSKYYALKVP